MAKLAQNVAKYNVVAKLDATGTVEKPDVIGAVFGQTEGLLGNDLDLRELQRTGRIGRIEVNITTANGKSTGTIIIPSSLDAAETTLIAASLETIERVGPCDAKIKVEKVEDLRDHKRDYVVNRAKELLSSLSDKSVETEEISERIKEAVRVEEIIELHGLPAGPGVLESDTMIFCEGRADVLNLLRNGVKTGVAVGGTSANIPEEVKKIAKEKTTIAFLDGDRGGDLILKELQGMGIDIDFVARAPEGKEVEELTKKEVHKAIREKVAIGQAKYISEQKPERHEQRSEFRRDDRRDFRRDSRRDDRRDDRREDRREERRDDSHERKEGFFRKRPAKIADDVKAKLSSTLQDVLGTHAACIFNENMEILGRVPSSELENALRSVRNIHAIVIDDAVNNAMIQKVQRYGVKVVVATSVEGMIRSEVTVMSQKDLEGGSEASTQ